MSVAEDELGNIFEQIMDEGFNTLGTRLFEPGTKPLGEVERSSARSLCF